MIRRRGNGSTSSATGVGIGQIVGVKVGVSTGVVVIIAIETGAPPVERPFGRLDLHKKNEGYAGD